MSRKIALCAMLILLLASVAGAQIVDPPAPPAVILAGKPEGACLAFTQKFYVWYLALDQEPKQVPASVIALKQRRANFHSELLRLLAEDYAASAKVKDEIVGLDFDPIMNTQDPADHYLARKVTKRGKSYFVEVFGVIKGKRNGTPDVIPELVQSGKQWVFVNFHYPAVGKHQAKSDLLGVLKELRVDRARNHR